MALTEMGQCWQGAQSLFLFVWVMQAASAVVVAGAEGSVAAGGAAAGAVGSGQAEAGSFEHSPAQRVRGMSGRHPRPCDERAAT